MPTLDVTQDIGSVHPARALTIVALVWGVMTMWNFDLPGLQMDEANHYAFIPGIKSEAAAQLVHFRLPDNYIDERDGVRRFPIVGGSVYNSVMGAYLGLPYFAVTGHSQGSLRIFSAGLALVAILAITNLVGTVFGWSAAALAGAIIATDPSHVFSARSQGASIWPVILFWALSANLLLHSARHRDGSAWAAALGGACLGFSVMSYFIGLFLALPIVAAALIVYRRNLRQLALFIGAGLLAFSPFIYAMISIYIEQPELLGNFGVPDWAERPSIERFSLENLSRLKTIVMGSFASSDFAGGITGRFSTEAEKLRILAFLIAAGLCALIAVSRRAFAVDQRAFFWLVGAILLLHLTAMFLLKATSVHHLLPVTTIAAAACASTISIQGWFKYLALGICAILLVSNLASLRAAHASLLETGGRGYHNESYSLAPRMLAGPLKDYHPVFVGWGSHLQFLFLTDGRMPYSFAWGPDPERVSGLLKRHERAAVVVPHGDSDFVGKHFVVSERVDFRQRNGQALFAIFLLEADRQSFSDVP